MEMSSEWRKSDESATHLALLLLHPVHAVDRSAHKRDTGPKKDF